MLVFFGSFSYLYNKRPQGFDFGLCTFRHILSTFTFYTITIFSCTKAITVSNIEDKMSLNVKPIDIDRPLVAGWQYKKKRAPHLLEFGFN